MSMTAPTLTAAARNAAVDAVVDLLDVGTTNPTARRKLLTSGDTLIATHNFSEPAYGNASGGVATSGAIANATAVAAGTVAKFEDIDRDETVVRSGPVTQRRNISGVNQGNRTFSVAADITAELAKCGVLRVTGSTGNDGFYTVEDFSENAGTTTITVLEAIPNATVDGKLHTAPVTLDNLVVEVDQVISAEADTFRLPE